MTTTNAQSTDSVGILRDLFGDYRAEWAPERFRELFVEPSYFKKLEKIRPSLLMGGRGTGKTTALRSLRFDATLERLESSNKGFDDQEHLGIFMRMNKNRVHAFQGRALEDDQWQKTFAHYFNLMACSEMTELTSWLAKQNERVLSVESTRSVCSDLGLTPVTTVEALRRAIKSAISELQIFVNNPSQSPAPILSMAEVPLRTFATALQEEGLTEDRTIFCCIDEYENLLDSQQAILNTYIKHAEPPLSYKVGVRKNGLRTHQTIAGTDPLRAPDDFDDIDIAQEGFDLFAQAVAGVRLTQAQRRGADVPDNLAAFLEDMSISAEADLLGATDVAAQVFEQLKGDPVLSSSVRTRVGRNAYFLKYWAESEKAAIEELAQDWLTNEEAWKNRLNNYGYASLFWLSHGRKGARIKKYYSGAGTFLTLPGGNIRYFLELIDAAIANELDGADPALSGRICLSAKAQTAAARAVGQRRLEQLEGLAPRGVSLKRLVLAIGKVFFELARSPLGRTPEVTSFVVTEDSPASADVIELLEEGVDYLAFEATPRTKATTPSEMRNDEYRLHPIFCAFFEISHRRKRRTTFRASDLLLVREQPSAAITRLLGGTQQTDDEELPEQLALFSSFFRGGESV